MTLCVREIVERERERERREWGAEAVRQMRGGVSLTRGRLAFLSLSAPPKIAVSV